MTTVRVDLSGLRQFKAALAADLRGSGQGPVRDALKQWAARYRAFLQEEFVKNSRGGGSWAPLAASTVLGRRAGRGQKGTRRQAARGLLEKTHKLESESASLNRQLTKAKKQTRRDALQAKIRAKAQRISEARAKRNTLVSGAGVAILRDTGVLFGALNPVFSGKPGALEEHIPMGVRVGFGGPGAHPGGKATIADIAQFHNDGAGKLPMRMIVVEPPAAVVAAMADDMQKALNKLADQ